MCFYDIIYSKFIDKDNLGNRALTKFLTVSDIYFHDMLISDEPVIRKYLKFLEKEEKEQTKLILHTGSICFDVIAIVCMLLKSISENDKPADEKIGRLKPGDMVVYIGKRYIFRGIGEEDGEKRIFLCEKGDSKNSDTIISLVYETAKQKIEPYYGESKMTTKTGLRMKDDSLRKNFLAPLLGTDAEYVPSGFDFRVVVMTDKNRFKDILGNTTIRNGEKQKIGLMDLGLAYSYISRNGELEQFGENPLKREPNVVFTETASALRDFVIDKEGSHVMVLGEPKYNDVYAELDDALLYSGNSDCLISLNEDARFCYHLIEQRFSAEVFACTKDMLNTISLAVGHQNSLTSELNRQLLCKKKRMTIQIDVPDGIDSTSYREIRKRMQMIRWDSGKLEDFQRAVGALLKLFMSAFFPLCELEKMIDDGLVGRNVALPSTLMSIVEDLALESSDDDCIWIAEQLRKYYDKFYDENSKQVELKKIIEKIGEEEITIVMPKAYYAEVYAQLGLRTDGVTCTTIDKFDNTTIHCNVIAVCGKEGKSFNPVDCVSAYNLYVMLYGAEKRWYNLLQKQRLGWREQIELRAMGEEPEEAMQQASDIISVQEYQEIQTIQNEEELLDEVTQLNTHSMVSAYATHGDEEYVALVSHVATFTTGEYALFTKNYDAVVYDAQLEKVLEKNVKDLAEGDTLIFLKKDEFTQNIVDFLLKYLVEENRLSDEVCDAYRKSRHWKKVLMRFKEQNEMTYDELKQAFWKKGGTREKETLQSWLSVESHIVGPRDVETMRVIANMTGDESLMSNPGDYTEACKIIRKQRVGILHLIEKVINGLLSGTVPEPGGIEELIYDNINKIAERLTLEEIKKLDEPQEVRYSATNRPLVQ